MQYSFPLNDEWHSIPEKKRTLEMKVICFYTTS